MIMFEYRYCFNFGIQKNSHDTVIKVCKDTELSDHFLVYFLYTGKYKTSTNNYSADPVS